MSRLNGVTQLVGSALLAVMIQAVAGAGAIASAAEPAPAQRLEINTIATPTHFDPAGGDEPSYEVRLSNVGAAPTDGSPITIRNTLPKGVSVAKIEFVWRYQAGVSKDFGPPAEGVCAENTVTEITSVTCTIPEEFSGSGEESAVIYPGEELLILIYVSLPPGAAEGEVLENHASVEGGGAPVSEATAVNRVSAVPASAGFSEFSAKILGRDGLPVNQAGGHPYLFRTTFALNSQRTRPGAEERFTTSGGDPKNIPVVLPPGFIGNPTAVQKCPLRDFNRVRLYTPFALPAAQLQLSACPRGSIVGYISLRRVTNAGTHAEPIYNLEPPPGMPAQLGFHVLNLPFFISTEVKPSTGYKVVGAVRQVPQARRVISGAVNLWGNPAGPQHDALRHDCLNPLMAFYPISIPKTVPSLSCPAGIPNKPFLRLPTSCGSGATVTMGVETWRTPGVTTVRNAALPALTGCNALSFDPSLKLKPTTNVADAPSGLEVELEIPQNEDPLGTGSADLRKAVVTLPRGVSVNPAQANGLEGCSSAQVGVDASTVSGFNDEPARCPGASKIGLVEVDTPLLDQPLMGAVHVAMPFDNPFNSLLAIYIVVNDPDRGLVVKLAGHVFADPQTGQLTTTFDDNPQVPFDSFNLKFFDGPSAPLRTPAVCGAYKTTSEMTPWSAPESGPPATPSDSFAVSQPNGGGNCPGSEAQLPNRPTLDAGTVSPIAKAYSPLVLNLRRDDGSQEFSALTISPPPGLLGRLAGIPYCSDGNLGDAATKPGRLEERNSSCPGASQVGSVEAGAGAGPAPYYARGKVYLAGPYKGAPLSLAVITPAVAGPFDLGTVVVRTALYLDPETAQIKAVSDPFPRILEGIPLDIRSISVRIDRPDFTLNPTNCDPLAFAGTLTSTLGQTVPLSQRFQIGECAALKFRPTLKLRLKGGAKRGMNPKLIATLKARPNEANIAAASVTLPRSAFLDQAHIRTICTRVQWAADACPRNSVYGRVSATTPLLDYPLSGKVYLRSSDNELPDLVADLRGPAHQPIRVSLVGRTDSVKGALRNTFDFVPDAPVSRFRLELFGGKRGLVVNSRNICARRYRAKVEFDGQNGKIFDSRPLVRNDCRKKKAKKHRRRGRR